VRGGDDVDYQRIVKIQLGRMQDGQRRICAEPPIFLLMGMVGTPSDTHSRDPSALPTLRTTQKTGAEAPVS
jgi:hypothetical protein